MKKIWIMHLITILSYISKAQFNLVPNASFENLVACPSSSNHVDDCLDWYHLLNTPDYYHTCASYPVSIPSNFFGEQIPFEGNAYMGLHTFASFFTNYREIIGAQLSDTLVSGFTYHVSMRVSRGNWTNDAICILATDKIGIRFTTYEHTFSNPPVINNFAQLYVDTLITDTLNWVLLSWDYISDSAYTHFYIGNFFNDSNTDTLNIGTIGQPYGRGGYYIDSLNIVCTNCSTGIIENEVNKPSITYNPISCLASIKIYRKSIISITNDIGQLIQRKVIDDSLSINFKRFGKGLFIILIDDGKNFASKKIINH